MSIRVSSAQNEFLGVVLAMLDVGFVEDFYRNPDPDGDRRIGLFARNGTLLAIQPLSDTSRYSLNELVVQLGEVNAQTYIGSSPVDGIKRIMSYRFVDEYPLLVSVSRDYRAFLHSLYPAWRRDLLVFLAFALGIGLAYFFLNRSIKQAARDRDKRIKLTRKQRRLERLSHEVITHIPNGRVTVVDAQLSYIFADGTAFQDHERLAPQAILGRSIRDVHRPEVADLFEPAARDALAGKETTLEVNSDGMIYEVTMVPLEDDEGEVERVLMLSQDVTDFKKTEQELELRNRELREISFTDALLNIANRRAFEQELGREWLRGLRKRKALGLLMIDVDYFKVYNDTYGHAAGDQCLQQVAGVIDEIVFRPGDVVARYGGEELAVLLPETDMAGALEVAERIHSALSAAAIPFPDSTMGRWLSVSIGATSILPSKEQSPGSLVEVADDALYAAKDAGRSCTESRTYEETAGASTE